MKFRVMFKTPDVLINAVQEEAKHMLEKFRQSTEERLGHKLTDNEEHAITEARKVEMMYFANKYVKHQEIIVVEFDPKKGTAVVVPMDEW